MTGHIAEEEEDGSSAAATVESPQRAQEEEHTEQQYVPEIPIEAQRANFGLLCAAHNPGGQCVNPAVIPCQICQLVAYCTEECMRKDAERHSGECPPPTEPPSRSEPTSEIPDDPVQDEGFFWANYAATDVLNLAANEGIEFDGFLRILLSGTFGLRHLIYSIVAMPETACPYLEVAISELEVPHLYRTFLSLLILRKGEEINMDPYEVADLVTHVWYSFKWPHHVVAFFKNHLAADFEPFTGGRESHVSLGIDPIIKFLYPSDTLALCVGFSLLAWRAMKIFLDDTINQKPMNLESTNQESTNQESTNQESTNQESILRDREKDVEAYGEPLENAFARMSPSRVAGLVKWRQTGLMLAYGDSGLPHAQLNPMFYCSRPESFTCEPLSEWPMNEILDYTPYAAEADVYGKMVAYVREMLVKFQLRLKRRGIFVKLTNAGTVKLSGHLTKCFDREQKFDRIEAGHLFDTNAPLCFLTFSPLLRHHEENPFATLLIMTRGTFTRSDNPRTREIIADEKVKLFQPVSQSLDSIAPPVQTTDNKYSAACVHRHFALQVFDREWDMFSDRWLADPNYFNYEVMQTEDTKRGIFQTGWLGLQFKRKKYSQAAVAEPIDAEDRQDLNGRRRQQLEALDELVYHKARTLAGMEKGERYLLGYVVRVL
ncbi:uncharacterized protein TrAtP1_009501 [Trichoderma atroviride]|uniref:uncharacterized protein n=1 Tax=Hypocrea atroviridis TaxID=63577 RepID=UPI003327CFCF|nr:hypothetical protein TrAtP1_009501 [Trichoderma atroviride]